jgi:hypothetical protein
MPMIGSFYAPSEWAQPNQRNIGDSLLDLYKMKRQIEQDRMAAEESRMALETKKLAMQESLERAKQEREGKSGWQTFSRTGRRFLPGLPRCTSRAWEPLPTW